MKMKIKPQAGFRDIQFSEAHRRLSELVREIAGNPDAGYRIWRGDKVVAELVGLPLEAPPAKAPKPGRSRGRKAKKTR